MSFNNKNTDMAPSKPAPKLSHNQTLMKQRGYSDPDLHSNHARAHHFHTGGDSHHYGNAGSSGTACFPGDIEVLVPGGWRAIAKIKEGDAVLCLNDDWRQQQGIVEQHRIHPPCAIAQVVMAGGTVLEATRAHALLTTKGWRRIGKLRPGDLLLYFAEETGVLISERVERIEHDVRHVNTHNLVIGWHLNFIVRGAIAHSFSYARRLRTHIHRTAHAAQQQAGSGAWNDLGSSIWPTLGCHSAK